MSHITLYYIKIYQKNINNNSKLNLTQPNNHNMQQIYPTSVEWNQVKFKVQLIVSDPSVQLIRVVKYTSQFEQKYINHMKIDCAYNASQMKDSDLDLIKYNYPSRFVFQAGHIKLHMQRQKINKLLLFRLAIDQIMPIHKSGTSQLQNISEFPQGIDTIYISQNKQQLNIYPHKYRVKDKSQCNLQYQVDFKIKGIQNISKWNPKQLICQFCEVNQAVHYCHEQKQIYCGKCFEQLHRSSKKKHHRQNPISPFNSAPLCAFHPKQRYSLYCFDCMQLKCDKCIENQSHKNKKNHTQVMGLSDLETTLKQKQTDFVRQSKQIVKNLILKSQSLLSKLSKSYQEQKADLQQKFTIKLTKIREQNNKKLMRALSIHEQLKRKFDQILWAQNFLHYCQQFLPAQQKITINNSFFVYLQNITVRDYFKIISKNLQETN